MTAGCVAGGDADAVSSTPGPTASGAEDGVDFATGPTPTPSASVPVYADGPPLVVFVPDGPGAYADAVAAQASSTASALGLTWRVEAPSAATPDAQIAAIRAAMDEGATVLQVAPISPSAIAPVLAEASAGGITVVTVGSDVAGASRSLFIQPVDGTAMARGLVDAVMNPMGSTGGFGIVSCDRDDPTLTSWIAAQRAYATSSYPDARVVGVAYGGSSVATAAAEAKKLIAAQPSMTGVIGECQTATLGVAQAIRESQAIGRVFSVGVAAPLSVMSSLYDGSVVYGLYWDAGQLGQLLAWSGAQLESGTAFSASNRVSDSLTAVSYDGSTQSLTLGPPLLLYPDNITDYEF